MTDREKIREAVEKRYEYWREKEFNSHSIESEIRMSECQHLLLMLNSLQEESVSEELEKEIDRAHRIFYDEVGWDSDEGARAYVADWFAHYFANWQKHHMEANRIKHCNSITNEQAELEQKFLDEHLNKHDRMPTFLDAVEYGMRLQKEQMMKNAVECEYFDGSLFRNDLREKYRDCDKVKIVIVKNE